MQEKRKREKSPLDTNIWENEKPKRANRTMEFTKVYDGNTMRKPKPKKYHRPPVVTSEIGSLAETHKKSEKRTLAALRDRTKQKIEEIKIEGIRLPWASILLSLICTVTILCMVAAYVRLNELTNEYSDLQLDIVELISEKRKLTVALEQKNDLLSLEEEAEKAGMVQSDRVEKRYLSLGGEDKIEVPKSESEELNFFVKIKDVFLNLFNKLFG